MSEAFFVSWQLWEQMTFVLGCAIVLVFCLGWTKLWWTSRRNKKQAVVDEEKRVRIQDLRMSGSIIKLDQENHIPFGVRALQSGIEIDGIWVSASSTIISESLRQLRGSEHSSDSSLGSNSDGRPLSPGELIPPRISLSGPMQPALRASRVITDHCKALEVFRPSNVNTLSWDVASAYKPRHSSHLRFSSSGENQVHRGTLSQLEGVDPMLPWQADYEHKSYCHATVADSSSDAAADNECSSESDSDSNLADKDIVTVSAQPGRATSSAAVSKKGNMSKGRAYRDHEYSTTSVSLTNEGSYFRVPQGSPTQPKNDPFSTPDTSQSIGSISMGRENRQSTDQVEALGETRWPLLSTCPVELPTEPVFMPGTLHLNKTARKINSGFELLPAGTFDSTTITLTRGIEEADTVGGDEVRRSKRLQKRGRESITGRQMSSSFGKW